MPSAHGYAAAPLSIAFTNTATAEAFARHINPDTVNIGCSNYNGSTIIGNPTIIGTQNNVESRSEADIEELLGRIEALHLQAADRGQGAPDQDNQAALDQDNQAAPARPFAENSNLSQGVIERLLEDVLERLDQMPEAFAQQFQNEDGPIQEAMRSVWESYHAQRRNEDENADGEVHPCHNHS